MSLGTSVKAPALMVNTETVPVSVVSGSGIGHEHKFFRRIDRKREGSGPDWKWRTCQLLPRLRIGRVRGHQSEVDIRT